MGLYRYAPGRMGTQLNEDPERLQPRTLLKRSVFTSCRRDTQARKVANLPGVSRCGILRTSRIPEAPVRVSFLLPSTNNSLQAPGLEPAQTASE
jgi:hypothetical protein